MFKRNLIPIWIGVLMMASFFLVGQDWGTSATGGGLHLIDAEGNDLGIFTETRYYNADHPGLFDPSRGLHYQVDLWTGETYPDTQRSKNFESDDCSGPWYVRPVDLGRTFTIFGDPTIYTVTAVANKTIRSFGSGSECFTQPDTPMLVGSSLATVTIPSSFPGPLHYEAR